jgi:hypothetical protein
VGRTPAVQPTTHSPPRSCNRRNPGATNRTILGARARRGRTAKNAVAPGTNGTAQSTTKRRARAVIANATLANIANSLPERIRVVQARNRTAGQTRARRQRRRERGWAAKCAMAPGANGMAQSTTNDGDAPSGIRIPRDPPHPSCPAESQRPPSPRRLKPPPEPLQRRRARAQLQALAPLPRRQQSQQRRHRPRRSSPVRQHRRSLAARGMQPHARATLQSAPRAAVPSCTCPDRSQLRRLRPRSPRRTRARKVRRGTHERL